MKRTKKPTFPPGFNVFTEVEAIFRKEFESRLHETLAKPLSELSLYGMPLGGEKLEGVATAKELKSEALRNRVKACASFGRASKEWKAANLLVLEAEELVKAEMLKLRG